MTEAGNGQGGILPGEGAGCAAKTTGVTAAGLVEGRAVDQYRCVGEFPKAGSIPPAQLYRLDIGCEEGRDAPQAYPGGHRTPGKE